MTFVVREGTRGSAATFQLILLGLLMSICTATSTFAQGGAAQPDLKRADELVKSGRAAEAYDLLAPFEDRLSGNVEYDYLLGIAALDSNKSDRATLAFERVLAVNPNFAGARLDMARAYFQLGDISRAKAEFDAVLSQDPPAQAREIIARYTAAIEAAEKAKLRTIRFYAEYTLGRDNNVNNSTSQSQINVPALGNLPFNLSATNLKTKDSFNSYSAGGEYTRQFTPKFGAFVGADLRKRINFTQDTFDNESRDMRGGISLGEASNQFRLTANAGRHDLDNRPSRKAEGLGGEWRYALDPATQLNAFSQYSRSRFTSAATQVNSFNQVTSGVGGLRIFADGKAAIFGSYFLGKERDTEGALGGRADGAKSFDGVRLGGQYTLHDNFDLFSFVSNQRGNYGRINAAFLTVRRDETTDFVLGGNWRFAKDWTLRPQFLESRNTSNIPLYGYKRAEYSVTVRRDFSF